MTLERLIGQFKAYTEYPNQDTFVISNQECKDILKYLTEQKSFIDWVASEVVSEDWEFNNDAFAEIACRKLVKLGIVKLVDGEYFFKFTVDKEEAMRTNSKGVMRNDKRKF